MNLFLNAGTGKQQVHALLTCKQVTALESLFDKLLDETKASLVRADDMATIHRLQGRAQVLNDFLEAVNDAPSVMERLK
jgi:arginine repressor